MKIAIIADIHSNLEAFEVALDKIQSLSVEKIYCLGDVVGYGSDASACVDLVQKHCVGTVLGNHDEAVAFPDKSHYLPSDGRAPADHNREQLSESQLEFLQKLPLTIEADGLTFVHAAPQKPAKWQRLDSMRVVKKQFGYFKSDICFVGHSHVASIMGEKMAAQSVSPGRRYLINPGSIGQPRDFDPRLGFGVIDTDSGRYEGFRLHYDIEKACEKIKAAGLPEFHGERLKYGR